MKPRNLPTHLKSVHRHKSQMKEPEELKYKKKLFQGSTSHFQSRLGGAHSFKAENV